MRLKEGQDLAQVSRIERVRKRERVFTLGFVCSSSSFKSVVGLFGIFLEVDLYN